MRLPAPKEGQRLWDHVFLADRAVHQYGQSDQGDPVLLQGAGLPAGQLYPLLQRLVQCDR